MKVAVIGAGIVGASCAFHLSRRGARVIVLERAVQAASGSTARSAAGIRQQFSHPENVRMSLYSASVLERFQRSTGHDPGYSRVGYLFLLPPELLASWQQQLVMQQQLGVRVRLLTLDETTSRFPYLALEGVAAASLGIDDGIVDPHAITMGFLAAARKLGSKLRLQSEVLELSRHRGSWQLVTRQETLTVDAVINAAGPAAAELAGRAGIELPLEPMRRNVYTTTPIPNFPHPTPLLVDMNTGVYLRSEGPRFIFGLSNPGEPPGFNLAVDWAWLEHTLAEALPRFPFLATASLDRQACWAGLYVVTPDHSPILGRMPGVEGFFNACGFSGHGVQHAPATGKILAEEVIDGEASSFAIDDFRFERFTRESAAREIMIV